MTKISTYTLDEKITALDKWIGSDVNMQNRTKNFTPKKLAEYFNDDQVINIGIPLQYKYYTLEPLEARPNGTLTFETEIGPTVNFSAITTFLLSKYTTKQNIVSDFLNFLDGCKVLLFKSSDINSFGFYRISNIEPYEPDPNFFVVTVDYETGNGFMQEDNDYMLSLVSLPGGAIPTKTSELINDGDNGINPFISEVDINRTEWNAAYDGKINSAEVTGTTTKTLTLTKQDGSTIEASWTDDNTDAVTSVFGRTGDVTAQSGDYNTGQIIEVTNKKYQTDNQALFNDATSSIQTQLNSKQPSLGYTPVPNTRTITINGTSYDLSANRSWTIDTNSAVWGNISGMLSNQTDLQIALNAKVPYSGAAGNINLGEYGLTSGYYKFDLTPTGTPTSLGTMYWDSFYRTVSLIDGDGDTTLQIGQEERVLVHNNTGSTLTDGQVVYVTGSTGELPSVSLASNTSEATSSVTFGVVTETILNGADGFITTSGIIHGLNTLSYDEGSAIWLGSTPGTFTQTKPVAPLNSVLVGYVIKKSGGNGSIFVKIQNGYELEELHDVLISNVSGNEILAYEGSPTNLWKNKSVIDVLGFTPYNSTNPSNYISLTALSSTATGLSYNNTNGVFSLTSGYVIPTTTEESNWNTAYSNRITSASLPLSISSNSISISQATSTTNGYLSNVDWSTFNGKANDNAVVKLTGDQTISGVKTFSNPTIFNSSLNIASGAYSILYNPANSAYWQTYVDSSNVFIFGYNGNIVKASISNSGNFTANSFIKSGGTSSQFLKADGSVDSSTYLTSLSGAVLTTGDQSITGQKTFDSTAGSSDAIEIISNSTGYGINLSHPSGGTAIFIDNPVGVGLNVNNIGTNSFGISISNPSTGRAIYISNGGAGTGIYYSNSHTGNGIYSNNLAAGVGFYSNNASTGQGIHSINNSTGIGILSNNNLGGTGINSINSSTGNGINSLNTGSGIGIGSTNNSTGSGIYSINQSTGKGIYAINSGSGQNLVLNNTTAATGMPFTVSKNGTDKFTINDAGEATGIKFIKSGGTSSQFLKADGSVDSSTYALTSQLHDAVTIGTANGLSLSGQVLSLALASPTTRGALTSEDYNYFFDKVQGNGNQNYIPKYIFSGSNKVIGNSLIYDNGTNVGIGTASPLTGGGAAKWLTLEGSTYSGGIIGSVSGVAKFYNYFDNASNTAALQGASGVGVTLWSDSTERMRITSGGNVGIGTTSPSQKLVVDGGTADFMPIFAKSSLLSGGKYFGSLLAGYLNDVSKSAQFGYVYDTSNIANSYAHITTFGASEGSQFAIKPNGNVGIGTTSPSTLFHIYKASFPILTIQSSSYQSSLGIDTTSGNLVLNNESNAPLSFNTNATERMRITSGGSVGIGTTSPDNHKLQITASSAKIFLQSTVDGSALDFGSYSISSAYPQTRISMVDDGNWGGHMLFSTKPLGASTNTLSERMRITSGGNVGIGTTSPDQKLTVVEGVTYGVFGPNKSTISAVNTTTDGKAGFIDVVGYSGNTVSPYRWGGISGGKTSGVGDGNYGGFLSLWTTSGGGNGEADSASYERMRITSGGRVGVGTINPLGKFQVTLPTYDNEDTDSQQAIFGSGTSGYGVRIGYSEAGNFGVINSLKPSVAWGNLSLQSGGGNVLIGTTINSGYKLDVAGTGRVTGSLTINSATTPFLHFHSTRTSGQSGYIKDDGNMVFQKTESGGGFRFLNSSSSVLLSIDAVGASAFSNNVTITPPSNQVALRVNHSGTNGAEGSKFNSAGSGTTYGSMTMLVDSCNYGTGIRIVTGLWSASQSAMQFYSGTTSVGSISCTTSATAYNTSSDYRLKENVVPMESPINRLKELNPCRFNFINNPDKTVDGFIAHEVQGVIPEAITGEKDELDYDGSPKYQGIDQSKIVPLLTAALQEAISKIEELENRLLILENK